MIEDDIVYEDTPVRTGGPGRGCIAVLIVILVLLLMCCCVIIGLTALYYLSPEFKDLITSLLSGFLLPS